MKVTILLIISILSSHSVCFANDAFIGKFQDASKQKTVTIEANNDKSFRQLYVAYQINDDVGYGICDMSFWIDADFKGNEIIATSMLGLTDEIGSFVQPEAITCKLELTFLDANTIATKLIRDSSNDRSCSCLDSAKLLDSIVVRQ